MLFELLLLSSVGGIYSLSKCLTKVNKTQRIVAKKEEDEVLNRDCTNIEDLIKKYLNKFRQMDKDYKLAKKAIKANENVVLKKLNKKLKDLKKQEEFYADDVIDITAYQDLDDSKQINIEDQKLQDIKDRLNSFMNSKGNK